MTHVPSAIASPSTNMPISTVTVAATVVDALAKIERTASETSRRSLFIRRGDAAAGSSSARPTRSPCTSLARVAYSLGRVASAALVAGQPALLERDHALPHLVDHLAVVGDHQDRRPGAVDAVEELHDPDGGVRIE